MLTHYVSFSFVCSSPAEVVNEPSSDLLMPTSLRFSQNLSFIIIDVITKSKLNKQSGNLLKQYSINILFGLSIDVLLDGIAAIELQLICVLSTIINQRSPTADENRTHCNKPFLSPVQLSFCNHQNLPHTWALIACPGWTLKISFIYGYFLTKVECARTRQRGWSQYKRFQPEAYFAMFASPILSPLSAIKVSSWDFIHKWTLARKPL